MVLNEKAHILKKEEFKYEIYTLPALSYIGAMETKLGLYTGVVIRDATRDPDVLNFCASFPFEYYCYDGIPRYLIRGFMRNMLPECILYPVLKTGVQSADWLCRLEAEKTNAFNRIQEMVEECEADYYINSMAVSEILKSNSSFVQENELQYFSLFFAYILHEYLSSNIE